MKNILIIGAGRSSSALIRYIYKEAVKHHWQITVTDQQLSLAEEKTRDFDGIITAALDVADTAQRQKLVSSADVIISMLPPSLHINLAHDCLILGKHLLTASYVSPAMQKLHEEAKQKGLLFVNEAGLDPGIDHLSAMKIIDSVKQKRGRVHSFKSFCGGLVAPQSDTNPWGYKFTWNPRNVVLAGQGTVQYIIDGQYKYIPFHKVFAHTEQVHIPGYGDFEAYPNRDSLSYRSVYNLQEIPTMLRGTLRRPGYCKGWQLLVQLGLTEDSYTLEGSSRMTYREFLNAYLPHKPDISILDNLASYTGQEKESEAIKLLQWLGLFEDTAIGLANATPAQILQQLLEEKWKLQPEDKDMIVMQHLIGYTIGEDEYLCTSSLVVEGEDATYTAMALTVGLPLGIIAKLLMQDRIQARGVVVPVTPEFYEPVLDELAQMGIQFKETEQEISSVK
jgi:saccharopine dehydrogenase-like NADP-dependent oxidoreductase